MTTQTAAQRRQTTSSGTPDPYIAEIAEQQRAVAQMHLGWQLDRLRLEVGQVEVVPRSECPEPQRRLFRKTRLLLEKENRKGNIRFLPFFDGTGVLIRDRPGIAPS